MSLADFLLTKCRHALDKAFAAGTTFSVPSLAVALVVAVVFCICASAVGAAGPACGRS